ncbi:MULTISPECIES: hypothetical protein [Bradyrhizobium]|jgi:hypothetical protein|uniref:Uncharacterized protein n=1 Tax=Bradyrhizobium elkanii TaxID=29448 RepID=A0A7Y8RC13_BRAEL|nr:MULTISPECIES: hypothetical protein [Bradyrhizobium]MBP1293654.1 hypothetical protein [Bradyrhizobium elkanii]MCP1925762.1 hypothetical protein [Bradyrhizobium elkanii]MCS3451396.1 hypothetical protein [Bradyrhizobium elkanii]MCS3476746.1 hypothetical protein [Bradyrhizobium elkanii]MCS3566579.1 hypothetical protein [Bradyrhizobium elkanii]
MNATLRLPEPLDRLPEIVGLSSQRTLSFFSVGMRGGFDLPLDCAVPLNFFRAQSFTAAD